MRAIEMKIQGLTYAEIGKKLGVSRQRAQQLVCPPKEIVNFVRKRAHSKCEECDVQLESGHVHHVDNSEDYNDVDNLQYLCASCHSQAHIEDWQRSGPKEPGERLGKFDSGEKIKVEFTVADQELIAGLKKKLGVRWQSLVRMGLRVLAREHGVAY